MAGCSSVYKSLRPASGDALCLQKFRPVFSASLYNTQVNVVGNHLSGLLLFKAMPDSSMRIVFSNEMGMKFFDFEFAADNGFKVHHVMKKLNKKSVIKTLQDDFQLILMRHLAYENVVIKEESGQKWYGFPNGKNIHYYITDVNCDSLIRVENAMKRKPKVRIVMQQYDHGVPDTIGISHKNFNFDIGLKYIRR
jgi:ketol-acid reductoisomerase